MRTLTDIITEVLVRSNRSTTDSFITDTQLKNWYKTSTLKACAYHKWPCTEGRVSTTFASGAGTDSDEYFFEGYKADSFRIMTIGGKRLQKLNHEDYQIFREEQPDANDRVFTDFGRLVFVNPKIDLSGTLVAYGQYQPAFDMTDETQTTPFSDWNEEGNEAIVEFMLASLKRREHLVQEAELHEQRGKMLLDEMWKHTQDEQFAYQTHADRGGMFERIDVVNGELYGESFNTDQF